MTERRWRWVTRDHADVQIHVSKGAVEVRGGHGWTSPEYSEIPVSHFGIIFPGLTIPTDRPIRVVFEARVLEDDDE